VLASSEMGRKKGKQCGGTFASKRERAQFLTKLRFQTSSENSYTSRYSHIVSRAPLNLNSNKAAVDALRTALLRRIQDANVAGGQSLAAPVPLSWRTHSQQSWRSHPSVVALTGKKGKLGKSFPPSRSSRLKSLSHLCAERVGMDLGLYASQEDTREDDTISNLFSLLPPAILTVISVAAFRVGAVDDSNIHLLCRDLVEELWLGGTYSEHAALSALRPNLLSSFVHVHNIPPSLDCWADAAERLLVSGCMSVKELALRGPNVSQSLVKGVCAGLPGLRVLRLISCLDSDTGPESLLFVCKHGGLQMLDVSGCEWFTDLSLRRLAQPASYGPQDASQWFEEDDGATSLALVESEDGRSAPSQLGSFTIVCVATSVTESGVEEARALAPSLSVKWL
jgi:hypothetical protein